MNTERELRTFRDFHVADALREIFVAAVMSIRIRLRARWPLGLCGIIAATLDPFIYAAVLYFVTTIVLQRSGFARFQLMAIGIIAALWTIRCTLAAINFGELRSRLGEVSGYPTAAALAAVIAPPTLVFLLSMMLAIGLEVSVLNSWQPLRAVAWLLPTVTIHGIWNVVLVLTVAVAVRRRLVTSELPLVAAAVIVCALSPILYRLEDIPQPANLLLTAYNPASHVLAAYHNALWYGQPISLQVLPVAALVGILLVAAIARTWRTAPRASEPTPAAITGQGNPGPRLIVALNRYDRADEPSELVGRIDSEVRFSRWTGRVKDFTGEALIQLLLAVRQRRLGIDRLAVAAIGTASQVDRLYGDYLAIYPDWALAQLASAAAVLAPGGTLLLDGLLDDAKPAFVQALWRRLEMQSAQGRDVTVVTYGMLPLGESAKGNFVAYDDGRKVAAGQIGPELDRFYQDPPLTTGRAAVVTGYRPR